MDFRYRNTETKAQQSEARNVAALQIVRRLDHFEGPMKGKYCFNWEIRWAHQRNFDVGVAHLHSATEHSAPAYLPIDTVSRKRLEEPA